MPKEYIYSGRDNIASVTFTQDGSALNLTNTTRVLVQFEGTGVVADTDVSTPLVSWASGAAGTLQFKLGGLGLPVGEYKATIIVFDGVFTNGQVLTHMNAPDSADVLKFQVLN